MKIVFKNYKPFRGKHSVTIKPFNVFIGRNNSGKSSLSEIVFYSTNLRFLADNEENIFRINDTTRKNSFINHHANDIDNMMVVVGKIVRSIINNEIKLAKLEFEMKRRKMAHKKDFDAATGNLESDIEKFKDKHHKRHHTKGIEDIVEYHNRIEEIAKKNFKHHMNSLNEKRQSHYHDTNKLYEDLFNLETVPMWFLRNHIYPAVQYHIEKLTELDETDKSLKGETNQHKVFNVPAKFVLDHIKSSKIYRVSEYLYPHFQNGVGLEFDMKYSPFRRLRPGRFFNIEDHTRMELASFRKIADPKLPLLKGIYDDFAHIDGEWITRKIKGKKRPSFEKSSYYETLSRESNGNPVNIINKYFVRTFLGVNRMNRLVGSRFFNPNDPLSINESLIDDTTYLVKCKLNITDNDLDIVYSSPEGEIVNNAHISYSKDKNHIYGKMPAKFSYLHNSVMYNNNIEFVSTLIRKSARGFVKKVSLETLEGVLHLNNCYYYDARHHISSKLLIPEGVFPKPSFGFGVKLSNQNEVSTIYQRTLDNLPIKVKHASHLSSKKTLKNAKKVDIGFIDDKTLDKDFGVIYKKDGPQRESFDQDLEIRYNENKRIEGFENDIEVVAEHMQHEKFKHVVFPYFKLDKETNKVIGCKHRLKNLYAEFIKDLEAKNEGVSVHRNIIGLYKHILSKTFEINDLNRLYNDHCRKTRKLRQEMTIKDRKTLENMERFLIGGYLASASSKILEWINAYAFYKNFHQNLASENAIQGYSTVGKDTMPSDRPLKATIIDPVIFPKNEGHYTINDLEALFGHRIHDVVKSNQTVLTRLNTAVNNHLSHLISGGISFGYKFELGFLAYTSSSDMPVGFDNETLPNAYSMTMTEITPDGKAMSPPVDFSRVGQGTRNLVAIFMQIELAKMAKGRRDNLLIIREPENYLHPNLIGKFIGYLVKVTTGSSITIVLETHSETIVRQLQVLVKKASEIDDYDNDNPDTAYIDKKNLSIHYIENDFESGSYIKELKVDDDGYLEEEIPENFLGVNADLVTSLWKK